MSNKEELLTQQIVKNYFDYKDGLLYYKNNIYNNGRIKGDLAGCFDSMGYYCVSINNKRYYGHRIIFLWHHGFLPKLIDHIDRVRSNCNIENLRECTNCDNQRNTPSRKKSSSKYLGVFKTKRVCIKKFEVNIVIKGVRKYRKNFQYEHEAALAYNREAVRYYGEFANLNILKLA